MDSLEHKSLSGFGNIQPWDGVDPPRTRFPDLDIYDHGFDRSLHHTMDDAHSFSVRCKTNRVCDDKVQFYEKLVLSHLERYAQFIVGLTGQDIVSLYVNITILAHEWCGLVIAKRSAGRGQRCHLRSLESEKNFIPVTDFTYLFNSSDRCEDGLLIHSFVDKQVNDAKVDIKLSRKGFSDGSIQSLQAQIERYLNQPDTLSDIILEKESSVLPFTSPQDQPNTEDPSHEANLHTMFESQAKQNPERCAIEFLQPEHSRESPLRRRVLSYGELDLESERIAVTLREILKAKRLQGSQIRVVPVFISTSPELYMAYLAILKTGHAFCPLPIDAPSFRLQQIIEEIQPVVVLGVGPAPLSGPWYEVSRASPTPWLDIRNRAQQPQSFTNSQTTHNSLAYVMYTSGSSGLPKGIEITHSAAVPSILAHIKQYRETMPEKIPMRWYQFAAPTFDPSIMEIFVTLSNGGTLCTAPRDMTLSAPEIAITETRSTITMATPGIAAMLDVDRLPTLRCLWTMGEALSGQVIARFAHLEPRSSKFAPKNITFRPDVCLCNAYGPTEAAINVTFFPNVPQDMRGSIIGYPLGASRILVIDPEAPNIRPVPLGFVGELVVTGPQLALRYTCEPKRDLPAFVNDERYGRLYRTGDRARVVWDSNNVPLLEYLGRLTDDQIKINGQRVELGDIESVLCSIPMIQSAVAIARTQESKGDRPFVGCLVLEPGSTSTFEVIKERCREILALRLPSYMRPTYFLQFERLPLTSAGKVDRQKVGRVVRDLLVKEQRPLVGEQLKEIDDIERSSDAFKEEDSSLLQSLNDALLETTGVAHVAAESLQYELDSLSAMRFLRNVKRKGVESVSLKDILQARSIKSLAQVITGRSKEKQMTVDLRRKENAAKLEGHLRIFRERWQVTIMEQFKLKGDDIQDILPTTETQSRILLGFSNTLNDLAKPRNYIHHSLHDFGCQVDSQKLKDIWRKIVRKHDVYRTVFMPVDDEMSPFAQTILKPTQKRVQARWLEVFSDISGADNTSDINSVARGADALITLENATPVMTLLQAPKKTSILFSMVHAIFDLGSLQLLVTDFVAALAEKNNGYREELRTAVVSHFLPQPTGKDLFWDDYLSQQESSPFPSLTSVRRDATMDLVSTCQTRSTLTMANFERRSRSLLCSSFSVLQAAWSVILCAYTSSAAADVVFGSLLADRADEEKRVCVAPMFTVVPTRVRSNNLCLIIDVLRSLTEDNVKAARHLHSSTRSRRFQTRSYDTTIALQVFQELDNLKEMWRDTTILPMAHDYAVMIEAMPDNHGRICYRALYNDNFLDQSSAQLMLSQLDEIVIWMLANPMLPYLDALSCLKKDKLSLLNPNPKTRDVNDPSLLHSQFELNALAHPDRLALEFWTSLNGSPGSHQCWSYSDLNNGANRLAEEIVSSFGDVSSLVIPIVMEKRPELYLTILAVLKAGAGWSPIDISSPMKRSKDMISRLGAKAILTSSEAPFEGAGIPEGVEVFRVSLRSKHSGINNMNHIEKHRLPTPNSLAYVIWTSGTTGSAKAVAISHKAICTSMKALTINIPYKTSSGRPARCIQFAQQTFDVFVQDLFCTWNASGVVISASKQLMTGSFPLLCRKSGATHAHLTPAFAATVKRHSCPSLEVVTMIGEKLPQHVADDWAQNIKVYNTYGPAEFCVVATFCKISAQREYVKSSNIGRPLSSVSCHVIRNGKVMMTQGVGELALGGTQIAEGYLNDVERTQAKFIRYGSEQKKLYLTGDIVRQLADGTLDYVGREDDLIKLGGIRVELSEISHAMMDCHTLITQIETLHISRYDRPNKTVLSFIAADIRHDIEISVADGRAQPVCTAQGAEIAKSAMAKARQSLPAFMVPSNVVILREIPKTSSAKVDRIALGKAYELLDLELWDSLMCDDSLQTTYESSDIALNLRRCLSQFSGAPLETIRLQSSLHSLGIDSISVARFVQRLTKSNIKLSVYDILKCDTLAHALQILEGKESGPATRSEDMTQLKAFNEAWLQNIQLSLAPDASFVMPASPLQEGVIGESMLAMSSYWSNHFFELMPGVDIEKLNFTWGLVCAATEALRTSFMTPTEVPHTERLPQCSSSFLMLVSKNVAIDWIELDARSDYEHFAKQRADLVAVQHQQSFFHRPPWAVTILDTGRTKLMMLTIHHSLHDDESIKVLMHKLASVYNGLNLPRQYQITDVLSFSVKSTRRKGDEDYWRELLQNFADVPLASWPNLSPGNKNTNPKEKRSMLVGRQNLELKWPEFNQSARKLHTNCSIILKVAFGCLLSDYLESPEIVFGEILSQRYTNADYRDVIAPLVAIKPVPFTIRDKVTALISEQHALSASSRAHESLPGPLMRKILRRPRNEPLYPAIFAFHPSLKSSDVEKTLQAKLWHQREDVLGLSVEHDIALNVYVEDDLIIEVIAKDSLMDQENLEMFCLQIKALTEEILRNPVQPLRGLVDDADPGILSIFESRLSEAGSALSYTKCTYWLEHYAEKHPDWVAVEVASRVSRGRFETQQWSFGTLYKRSCKTASFLRSKGYECNTIAVCAGRTLQSYAIILGIFMSGNTYLPIDDTLPQQRKLLLLKDSNCSVLIVDSTTADYFDKLRSSGLIVNVDELHNNHEFQQASDAPSPTPNPDDPAYLIYTSGSTGVPKGVLISHRSLCGFVGGLTEFMNQCSTLAASQAGTGKWLGLASRAFDVHLAEMFLAWRSGLAAVTAPRELLLDDLRFAITELRVTHACFVPSLLEQAELEPRHIPQFVFMTIGGEKLSKHITATWAGHSRITAVNAYGPSEVSPGCTAAHIIPNLNSNNIGFPYGNTVAHVLIPGSLHYAKKGQAGELCFTGSLVGNGYHNRPDARGFVRDFHGQRMYRTGDMGRMLADGSLTYLGRSDDQTKLRGQRMELSEVSETIRTSSVIPLEVVTLIVDHPGLSSTFLTAFISNIADRTKRYDSKPKLTGGKLHESAIKSRRYCKENLPVFMVPDYVLPVDAIPLSQTSGKADARSLRTFFGSLPVSDLFSAMGEESSKSNQNSRELDPSERRVATIVQKTLKLRQDHELVPHENLFALGLDSLNAVGMILKFREIGFNCSLSLLLGSPTIETIAALGDWSPAPSSSFNDSATNKYNLPAKQILDQVETYVSKTAVEKILPCLPVQEITITATLTSQHSNHYINHVTLKLDEGIDLRRFKQSWVDLIHERPILRSVFLNCNDSFVQLVLCPEENSISWNHMTSDTASAVPGMIIEITKSMDREISHELQRRPPLRLHLVTGNDMQSVFIMSIHHALYDGESYDMMIEDIWTSYNERLVPHRNTIETVLDYRAAQDPATQKAFWQPYFKGFRPIRITEAPIIGHDLSARLDDVVQFDLRSIQDLASRLEVTLSTLTQYIFAIAFARKLKQPDVLFGTILSGRSIPVEDAVEIAAPCITIIPQRCRILPNESLLKSLHKTHEGNAKCLEHQHTSLRDISRWVHLPLPMFDALFSLNYETARGESATKWTQESNFMNLNYSLAVEFVANRSLNSLSVTCAYTAAFGSEDHAQALVEDMKTLLTMIEGGEDSMVWNLGLFERAAGPDIDVDRWDENHWSENEGKIKVAIQAFKGIESETITKNTTFFQLGIDSVSSIRLAKILRKSNIMVGPTDIMRYPSIGGLGQYMSGQLENAPEYVQAAHTIDKSYPRELVVNQRVADANSIEAVYECTPLQAGMINSTIASGGLAYVYQHLRALPSNVDVTRLSKAWNIVVQSLDILRTSFIFNSERQNWIAYVKRHDNAANLDLMETPHLSRTHALAMYSMEEAFKNPPWNAILSYDGKEKAFELTLHHALYDGKSLPMIFEVFSRAYDDLQMNLSHIPTFYSIAHNMNTRSRQAKSFWLEAVKGYDPIEMHQSQESSRQIHSSRRCGISSEEALQCCKAMGVTLQSVLLVAYAKLLAMISNRRDVCFGHVVAGRLIPDIDCENVIGPLFNTVPFRVQLDNLFLSNEESVKRALDSTIKAHVHQHASLAQVQSEWRRAHECNGARLFDSIFLFQNIPSATPNAFLRPLEVDRQSIQSEYCLNFELEQTSSQLTLSASYHKGCLVQGSADELLQSYEDILQDLLHHPSQKIGSYPPGLSSLPLRKAAIISTPSSTSDGEKDNDIIQKMKAVLSQISGVPVNAIVNSRSIFLLGLTSLSAITVAAECRKKGLDLSVADILRGVTVRGIYHQFSSRIEHTEASEQVASHMKFDDLLKAPVEAACVETIIPALSGQTYHLASWLRTGRTTYMPTWTYSCPKLDVERFCSAWKMLRARHPILRSTFAVVDQTKAVQIVLKEVSITNDHFTYGSGPVDLQTLKENVKFEQRQATYLNTPPVRIRIVQGPFHDVVLLTIHHALYDAWSLPCLLSDLTKLYRGLHLQSPPDWVHFVTQHSPIHKARDSLSFWEKTLNPFSKTVIGESNHVHHAEQRHGFVSYPSVLTDVSRISKVCHEYNVTLPTVLILSFARSLAAITNVTNPIFGIFSLGRSSSFPNISHIAGPCMNMLPLVVHSPWEEPWYSKAQELQQNLGARTSYEHSSFPDVMGFSERQSREPFVFDTFVNILWSEKVPATSVEDENDGNLLELIDIGVPSDFAPQGILKGDSTLEGLSWPLPDNGLYIDISLSRDRESISIGARTEGRAITDDKVKSLLRGFETAVTGILKLE